ADLRRSEYVPGRMERDSDAADVDRLAVFDRLDGCLVSDPQPQERFASTRSQVGARARVCMIGMRVSNDRAVYRLPGINVEISGGAVEAGFGQFEHRSNHHDKSSVGPVRLGSTL